MFCSLDIVRLFKFFVSVQNLFSFLLFLAHSRNNRSQIFLNETQVELFNPSA